ncbi:MAG: CPBP family intramembrane metalloprotease [Eubacterium sp.]|nr:CPBP family intramembrane metalloprotease [Eubacterium sp.]
MVKLSNQDKLHPVLGIVLFAVLMGVFLTAGRYLQLNFGITGLVLTEVIFLIMALAFCFITGSKIKEMFPIKKITVMDILGCFIIHIGGYLLSIASVGVVGAIYPPALKEADRMNDFLFGSMSFLPALIIVGLLPAVCEEAIHRGAILSNFRSIKKDWVIVLIMGILFGINHVSVIKFFSTAILGGVLSYVLVKKNNILLTMLMHFFNNAMSVMAVYRTDAGNTDVSSLSNLDMSSVLGVYLLLGFGAPFLLVIGCRILAPESFKKKYIVVAGIISAILLACAMYIIVLGGGMEMRLNTSFSYEVSDAEEDMSAASFDIEEDTTAIVIVSLADAEGDYRVRIDGDRGSNIINAPVPKEGLRTFSYQCGFQTDHYTVYIDPEDNAVGETPSFTIIIR